MADETLDIAMRLDTSQFATKALQADGALTGLAGAAAGLEAALPVVGIVVAGLTLGLGALAKAAMSAAEEVAKFALQSSHVAADFESARMGLAVYAKSAEDLAKQLEDLREIARLPGLGFEEAIRGSTMLQAVGFSAGLAERALMALGNAIATVGGGKADLDGVVRALMQIESKGKISAEEINQLQERVPQIRAAMLAAFGTADTEQLGKQGLDSQTFITGIIAELEKATKVTGGMKNAWENLADSWKMAVVSFGEQVNTLLGPTIDKLSEFLDKMSSSGAFATLAEALTDAVDELAKGTGSTGLPDLLVNAAAWTLSIIEQIPAIVNAAILMGQEFMDQARGFFSNIVTTVNSMINTLNALGPLGEHFTPLTNPFTAKKTKDPKDMNPMQRAIYDVRNRHDDIMKQMAEKNGHEFTPDTTAGFTHPSKANDPELQVLKSIDTTLKQTQRQISDVLLGGGSVMEKAVSARNVAGYASHGGLSPAWHRVVSAIQDAMSEQGVNMARGANAQSF